MGLAQKINPTQSSPPGGTPRADFRIERFMKHKAMTSHSGLQPAVRKAFEFLQQHLLWCLVVVYALGSLGLPHVGALGSLKELGLDDRLPLRLLLFVILFNAGLGVDWGRAREVKRYASLLLVGWAAGVAIPLAGVMVASILGHLFGLPAAYKALLGGFFVVAAMPVAGASAAWSQNTEANLVLSLGLVLFSTLISPLIGAVALAVAGQFLLESMGQVTSHLSAVAASFLSIWVVIPAVGGMAIRRLLGERRVDQAQYTLKLINLLALLVLYYWNAALTLPHVVAFESIGTVVAALVGAAIMAASLFATGEVLSRLLHLKHEDRVSLVFGSALKNNGAAMVLVSSFAESHHVALLAIIAYSLAQNVGAVLVTQWLATKGSRSRNDVLLEEAKDAREPNRHNAVGKSLG